MPGVKLPTPQTKYNYRRACSLHSILRSTPSILSHDPSSPKTQTLSVLCGGKRPEPPARMPVLTTPSPQVRTHHPLTLSPRQSIPYPAPLPLSSPTPYLTSFFCSMASCMILASFFFSRSRMDGESDCSSTFGNFLPKNSERGTGPSERQEQDWIGSTSEMDPHGKEKRSPLSP